MSGFSYRFYKTIQWWRVKFWKNDGEIPEFLQGKYKRMGVVAHDENLIDHDSIRSDPEKCSSVTAATLLAARTTPEGSFQESYQFE